MSSIKFPKKLPKELSFLTSEDLQQISLMCSRMDSNVTALERLTNTRSKKRVVYHNIPLIVVYSSKRKQAVPVLEDLFVGPVIPRTLLKLRRKRLRYAEHTKKRFQERFNIDVTEKDLQELAHLCTTKYKHIKISQQNKKNTKPRTKNLIHYKDTDIVAIYEESSDSIVTVMPPSYLKDSEHEWLYCSKRVRYKQLLKHSKELPLPMPSNTPYTPSYLNFLELFLKSYEYWHNNYYRKESL